ncbi:hypothetical protein YTPLAS72_02880 [Nitrospira sp.]|nr:hypothetical protein YTPLAS72_02880 [Nitrospira sp.]
MTLQDFIASHQFWTWGSFLVTMLAIAFGRHHARIAVFAFLSISAHPGDSTLGGPDGPRAVTTLLVVDGHALLYMGLVLSATMVIIALSYRYLNFVIVKRKVWRGVLSAPLPATFQGLVLTMRTLYRFSTGTNFLGLSLCSLIRYLRTRRHPLEAAVKYLLLSITASAILHSAWHCCISKAGP